MLANNADKQLGLFTSFALLAATLVLFSAIVVRAQDQTAATTAPPSETNGEGNTLKGITFPISELGSCTDKSSCKAYCNGPANIDACVAFAKAHGLMNAKEAERATKFGETIKTGGGPGGCTTPDTCKAFCSDFKNIETCQKFAEVHGVKLPANDLGKKLAVYLKSGGTTPGGCSSREACETYCKDLKHADECATFREKIGLTSSDNARLRKLGELMKSGETPGACSSKDACEAYCHDQNHFDECKVFALKAGLITTEQADAWNGSSTRPVGPGGCSSRGACEAYCEDDTHHDECLTFAQGHGFLSKDEVSRVKEGVVTLRAGLEQAPPEVARCVQTTLGTDVIARVQSGGFTPGSEVASQVRNCFEKFGQKPAPREIFKNAPPEILSCAKEKIGGDFDKAKSGQVSTTPAIADAFRVCFQVRELERGGPSGSSTGSGGGMMDGGMMGGPRGPQDYLRSLPPAVLDCVKGQLTGIDLGSVMSGQTTPPENLKDILRACFGSFRPMPMIVSSTGGMMVRPGVGTGDSVTPGAAGHPPTLVPAMVQCLRQQLSEEEVLKIMSGQMSLADAHVDTAKIKACGVSSVIEGGGPGTGTGVPPTTSGLPQPVPMPKPGGDGSGTTGTMIPPAVLDCARKVGGYALAQTLFDGGQISSDQAMQISYCLQNVQPPGALPQPIPNTAPQSFYDVPRPTAAILAVPIQPFLKFLLGL